jgi:hypothetical protein
VERIYYDLGPTETVQYSTYGTVGRCPNKGIPKTWTPDRDPHLGPGPEPEPESEPDTARPQIDSLIIAESPPQSLRKVGSSLKEHFSATESGSSFPYLLLCFFSW